MSSTDESDEIKQVRADLEERYEAILALADSELELKTKKKIANNQYDRLARRFPQLAKELEASYKREEEAPAAPAPTTSAPTDKKPATEKADKK